MEMKCIEKPWYVVVTVNVVITLPSTLKTLNGCVLAHRFDPYADTVGPGGSYEESDGGTIPWRDASAFCAGKVSTEALSSVMKRARL